MYDRQIKKSLATVLRHRITVQSETRTDDGEGGYAAAWVDVAGDVPASVDPIQARQQFQNRSVGVDATHVIKTRADVTVEEGYRIAWGSRTFEVLTVENINEIGEMLYIVTKERR